MNEKLSFGDPTIKPIIFYDVFYIMCFNFDVYVFVSVLNISSVSYII